MSLPQVAIATRTNNIISTNSYIKLKSCLSVSIFGLVSISSVPARIEVFLVANEAPIIQLEPVCQNKFLTILVCRL